MDAKGVSALIGWLGVILIRGWRYVVCFGCIGVTSTALAEPIMRSTGIFHPVVAKNHMVASQHALASSVGRDILRKGGNAIDAAIATGFALGVVLPRAGSIGGGGFMLVYWAKTQETIALDYREVAPALAHPQLFVNALGEVDTQLSRYSHLSAGVPGTVAGFWHIHQRFGTLPWQDLLAPAIRLAEEGFVVTHDLEKLLWQAQHLQRNPQSRAVFYDDSGAPIAAGSVLVQKDLAQSLKQIAEEGAVAFYSGGIAEKIVSDMAASGGLISAQDLASYRVVERTPVFGDYKGYQIASMPPPSSGGVHLLQMLNILAGIDMSTMGYGSAASIHWLAESMRRAYADRSVHLGDPDFVPVPVKQLLDKGYSTRLRASISVERATPSNEVHPTGFTMHESEDTTHFSVVDAAGNAVANTFTLNFSFGSGIMIPGAGILLNNEMDDFASQPGVPNAYGLMGGEANQIESSKRPLSSMTPTLVFKDGRIFIVTGSPGGSRIITTVLQVLLNIIEHKMDVATAVSLPRMHHQWWPDRLYVEPGFSPDTLRLLRDKGHQVENSRAIGSAQTILVTANALHGVADPRKPDAAVMGD